MTLFGREISDLRQCIVRLHEGQLTDEEASRLKSWLAGSKQARRIFADYGALFALLELEVPTLSHDEREIRNDEHAESDISEQYPADVQSVDSPPSGIVFPRLPFQSFLGNAYHGTVGFFSQEIPFSLLIATMICGLGLLVGLMTCVTYPTVQLARTGSELEKRQRSENPSKKIEYVGRITGTVDLKWTDPEKIPLSTYVALGREYDLTAGLMEITYDTGARVVLQGPCTYKVESAAGGYLSFGKLTARVEKNKMASGQSLVAGKTRGQDLSPSPLFTVRTPTATVTDLGTEFGVAVDKSRAVEVHVFAGHVEFQPVGQFGEIVRLGANEALRFEKNGAASISLPVARSEFAAALAFKKRVPVRVISVNFSHGRYDRDFPVTRPAGVFLAGNWNNTHADEGVLESLLDDQGKKTFTRVVWKCQETWSSSNPRNDGGNGSLMAGYLDCNPGEGANSISIEIANLGPPFSENGYRVIVYFDLDNTTHDGTAGFCVTDDAGHSVERWGKNPVAVDFPCLSGGPFIEAKSTSPNRAKPSNYAVFPGLAGTGFKIECINGGSHKDDRSTPCGLQIVSNLYLVPKPKTKGGNEKESN